jgi:hypothetical protein
MYGVYSVANRAPFDMLKITDVAWFYIRLVSVQAYLTPFVYYVTPMTKVTLSVIHMARIAYTYLTQPAWMIRHIFSAKAWRVALNPTTHSRLCRA